MGIHSFFILESLVPSRMLGTYWMLDKHLLNGLNEGQGDPDRAAESVPAKFQSYVPLLAGQGFLDPFQADELHFAPASNLSSPHLHSSLSLPTS